jgi:hypothetical protein
MSDTDREKFVNYVQAPLPPKNDYYVALIINSSTVLVARLPGTSEQQRGCCDQQCIHCRGPTPLRGMRSTRGTT